MLAMRIFTSLLLLAVLSATAVAVDAGTISTERGKVAGIREGKHLIYRGIPFAAPPVGALRWRSPQPVKAWRGVRAADRFAATCIQPPMTAGATRSQPESEDCLYLNIFRLANGARELPVLFWIPGGGLVAGSGSEAMYDGRALADQGVMVVTINYRVGRFGFFAHPGLTRANPDGGRLYNYGLMDQIAALQWVRRNIARFGGDPTRVTIFGESAGGASVDALMIAPEARGLFATAISQSGYGRGCYLRIAERSCDGDVPAESIGLAIARKLGMPQATIGELRAVPADRLAALFDRNDDHVFAVDGRTLRSDLWPGFARNEQAPVPLIIGSNSYEMGLMDPEDQRPWAEKVIPRNRWDSVTSQYADVPARDRMILGDIIFTTQARALAERHARNGHATYLYYFDVAPLAPATVTPGASHAAELAYVFGNFSARRGDVANPTADDLRVSRELSNYWVRFATNHGEPNGPGLPPWLRYDGSMLLHIRRDSTGAATDPLLPRVRALNAAAADIFQDNGGNTQ
jgi:para-nitrobenzyl esterase